MLGQPSEQLFSRRLSAFITLASPKMYNAIFIANSIFALLKNFLNVSLLVSLLSNHTNHTSQGTVRQCIKSQIKLFLSAKNSDEVPSKLEATASLRQICPLTILNSLNYLTIINLTKNVLIR